MKSDYVNILNYEAFNYSYIILTSQIMSQNLNKFQSHDKRYIWHILVHGTQTKKTDNLFLILHYFETTF